MKYAALIRDTFREMYARKTIVAVIVVEVFALVITALVLNSLQDRYEDLKEQALAAADSSSVQRPLRMKEDDSVLNSLPPADLPDDSLPNANDTKDTADKAPSKTFTSTPPPSAMTHRADTFAEGLVYGPMGVYSAFIAAAIILVGVFALAGIIPSMMEKGTIDLLVSKPMPRWMMLAGRMSGGFLALCINNLLFIAGVWALFGIFTGVWHLPFLIWTFVLPTFSLLVVYSGVAVLNVITESSVLPIILAYLHVTILSSVLTTRETTLFTFIQNTVVRGIIEGLYYILPQTNDVVTATPQRVFTSTTLEAEPFIQGAVFMVVMFAIAFRKFSKKSF